jgi:hypothetical protein
MLSAARPLITAASFQGKVIRVLNTGISAASATEGRKLMRRIPSEKDATVAEAVHQAVFGGVVLTHSTLKSQRPPNIRCSRSCTTSGANSLARTSAITSCSRRRPPGKSNPRAALTADLAPSAATTQSEGRARRRNRKLDGIVLELHVGDAAQPTHVKIRKLPRALYKKMFDMVLCEAGKDGNRLPPGR